MGEMEWLDEVEKQFPCDVFCGCSACKRAETALVKLIAAARLAEKQAHRAEKKLDLDCIMSARLELSGLVTRLRRGDVEE